MAEWPKTLGRSGVLGTNRLSEPVEVIPADLGRELYEALDGLEGPYGIPPDEAWKAVEDVKARYEREVGK